MSHFDIEQLLKRLHAHIAQMPCTPREREGDRLLIEATALIDILYDEIIGRQGAIGQKKRPT